MVVCVPEAVEVVHLSVPQVLHCGVVFMPTDSAVMAQLQFGVVEKTAV
jgi:hypothetical protein